MDTSEDHTLRRPLGFRKKGIADSESSSLPVKSGFVRAQDGTEIYYCIEGEGKPLVFCYGLICSSLHWTYQIEHFKRSYQTIWFDYRGHHNSKFPGDISSLSIENNAKDLEVLLNELKISEAVFLGHSMGVNVVLEFYRRYPERVSGMILANGTANRPLDSLLSLGELSSSGFKLLRKMHTAAPSLFSRLWKLQQGNPLVQALVTLGGFNPYLTHQKDIELYVKQVAETPPEVFFQLIEDYQNHDATAWLSQVRVPTLILAGQNDKMIPVPRQQEMHQMIPGSQLEIVPHGSHCAQMDLPDFVNEKITDFLSSVGIIDPHLSHSGK